MKMFNFTTRLKAIREEKRRKRALSEAAIALEGKELFPEKIKRAKAVLRSIESYPV